MSRATNAAIQVEIAKGWRPNAYLTNMSMAYFQEGDYVAKKIFPILFRGVESTVP